MYRRISPKKILQHPHNLTNNIFKRTQLKIIFTKATTYDVDDFLSRSFSLVKFSFSFSLHSAIEIKALKKEFFGTERGNRLTFK
jgi:hypothetical protein